jgi:hypothetical protein
VCESPVPYTKGVRPFGGRDYREVRPCRPPECQEYQKGLCKLRGHIQGIIPGTKGAGVWKIETGSIYSFLQMREQMEMVQRITGRLQNLINPNTQKPVFWLRKVTDSINRVDIDKGESTRTEQDLIYLEADIDMYELITSYQPQAVLERGERAQKALTGAPVLEASTTQVTHAEPANGKVHEPEKTIKTEKKEHEEFSCPKIYNADDTRCQGCDFPDDCKEQTKRGTEADNNKPAEAYQIKVITRGALKFKVEPKAIDTYCAGLSYVAAVEAIKMLNEGKFEFITI